MIEKAKTFNAWRRGESTTDGCSFAPDLDFGKTCCDAHDLHYVKHDVTREKADDELYWCIANSGRPYLAWIYWLAVRIFGANAWATWGGTKPLPPEEIPPP